MYNFPFHSVKSVFQAEKDTQELEDHLVHQDTVSQHHESSSTLLKSFSIQFEWNLR